MGRSDGVVTAVVVSALADVAGLLHQLSSDDRPPVPAMVLAALLAAAALVSAPALRQRRRWGWTVAAASRAGDALVLAGAAAAGKIFSEPTSHAASAVLQFLVSTGALALLIAHRHLFTPRSAVLGRQP